MRTSFEIHVDVTTSRSPRKDVDVTDVTVWIDNYNSNTGRHILGTTTMWAGTTDQQILDSVRCDIVSAISRNLNPNEPVERQGERNGAKQANTDEAAVKPKTKWVTDAEKYAHPRTRQQVAAVDGVDGLTPDMLRRRPEPVGAVDLASMYLNPQFKPRPLYADPMHD